MMAGTQSFVPLPVAQLNVVYTDPNISQQYFCQQAQGPSSQIQPMVSQSQPQIKPVVPLKQQNAIPTSMQLYYPIQTGYQQNSQVYQTTLQQQCQPQHFQQQSEWTTVINKKDKEAQKSKRFVSNKKSRIIGYRNH